MKFLILRPARLAMISLSFALLLASCQKNANDDLNTNDESSTYASEGIDTEASFNDVQDLAMTAAEDEGIESTGRGNDVRLNLFVHLRLRIGNNATVTVSPNDNTYPKTITIDFGNQSLGVDARSRKGKIIVHLTGPIRESGTVMTVTFENYKVGRLQITGTKIFTNLSANGAVKFNVDVDGEVRYPNGRGYLYQSAKMITQVAGAATQQVQDDIYEIEGDAQATLANGTTITLNTVDNLVRKLNCAWISDGSMDIQVNNNAFTLDYGFPSNGGCDNKALLQWNSNTEQQIIILP